MKNNLKTFEINFKINLEEDELKYRRANQFIYDFISLLLKNQSNLRESESITIKNFSCIEK